MRHALRTRKQMIPGMENASPGLGRLLLRLRHRQCRNGRNAIRFAERPESGHARQTDGAKRASGRLNIDSGATELAPCSAAG